MAQSIKDAVRAATGLSCSIGVAPNKLLAKISSDLDKPDGLTLLTPADIPARIWPLPARKVNGIGPKSSAKLEALGIRTIGELAQRRPGMADRDTSAPTTARGCTTSRMAATSGRWSPSARRSRSAGKPRSSTIFRRRAIASSLSRVFTDLCAGVSDDLRRKGYVGRTIGLKLRFDNFKTVTRDQTIDPPTQDAQTIRRVAGECLKRVPLDRRIRLLGVRASALTPEDEADTHDPSRRRSRRPARCSTDAGPVT